ncbi:hypothetical protein FQN57_007159 [Myotisia sp. PD_48]|nr:hypothetical protein FQN57_007159 [Myotisia sp. PD_48]
MAVPTVPSGTFLPGTKVHVGSQRVIIEKYLSEGGFAHVYVVRLSQPIDGVETAVLKRVAVPDKSTLANMRTEVETMKRLKGHRHIVTYMDSHASQLSGGGYEVFLLMEYCPGGGLIDFMNTRLQNRLTEPEILKIFNDISEGVACMHYLKPPLLHRDLKVENILIAANGSSSCYKLCDFGSAAPPRPAASSAAEGRLIEDDVQRHTTLQYRSPEMIDVYRKQPIDEKSDIWALGVLLYKLCYYTTPFEEAGQMAILNARFKYPSYPPFSDRIKLLIASMLRENSRERPTIYQVLRETCHMRGKEVPIRDIYAGRSQSETRQYQQLPPSSPEIQKVGAIFSPPVQETQILPEIAPMRRGRPAKPNSQHNSAKPSPSPLRRDNGDPFAALDKANQPNKADELSARFPTLDQFSLLHEKSGKFEFEPTTTESKAPTEQLSKRVTNALADEAFAKPNPSSQLAPIPSTHSINRVERSPEEISLKPSPLLRPESSRQHLPLHQPAPQKPTMVSTGTMTSPSLPPHQSAGSPFSRSPDIRGSSQPQEMQNSGRLHDHSHDKTRQNSDSFSIRPNFSRYEITPILPDDIPRSPASSRPSLEGSRPSTLDLNDTLTRSKSANSKARPVSAYVGSRLDFLRDRGRDRSSRDSGSPRDYQDGPALLRPHTHDGDREHSQSNISSDVDFLRAKEEEEMNRKREKRLSSGSKHVKRGSLTSLSLSGTKSLFAGRFGDAFRRFENNASQDQRSRTPSPEDSKAHLTPITGSEVTEMSDDGRGYDETDNLSPETRRELERRRLSMEEKRVADAAAAYRQQLNEKGERGSRPSGLGIGVGSGSRASAIEKKVQSLLKGPEKPPPVKTAMGYGRYTDDYPHDDVSEPAISMPRGGSLSFSPRNVPPAAASHDFRHGQTAHEIHGSPSQLKHHQSPTINSMPAPARPSQRPVAPPKPKSLRTDSAPTKQASRTGNDEQALVTQGRKPSTTQEDWELNFSRRYPSLSGLELVETEIGISHPPEARPKTATTIKEV